MKTVILSSFATIFATLVVNAQDIEQVKKQSMPKNFLTLENL
jgi:hypothetical protein